jgi:tetratricopeptide (TPR) repeat protein
MLAGMIAAASDPARGRRLLERVWAQGADPAESRFVRTYLPATRLPVQITPDLEVDEALGRNLVGLSIAELRQAEGDLAGAVQIVEQLQPTPAAALSLSELYFELGRYDDIVSMTDGLANSDDVTALLLVHRGIALRELGHHDAARLAFKEVLRFRSRSREVRFRALVERASSYHEQGKLALARKDIERIRAEDAGYPGLAAALTALGLDDVVADDSADPDDVSDALDEPTVVVPPPRPPPPPPASAGPPAGWYADPSGRHTHRYWDATRWTEHVADDGVRSVDPPA